MSLEGQAHPVNTGQAQNRCTVPTDELSFGLWLNVGRSGFLPFLFFLFFDL
jgi:hypothetical protein